MEAGTADSRAFTFGQKEREKLGWGRVEIKGRIGRMKSPIREKRVGCL